MTKLWYYDITRRSDFVTEQERSLALSATPRPSNAIRRAKSVGAAGFQARGYSSESG